MVKLIQEDDTYWQVARRRNSGLSLDIAIAVDRGVTAPLVVKNF
ncbi:hypothetical protein [Fischerella sp. PCC 9605]|nr:hypothetical protein [Fischerella sp. PCC 9605]